MNENLTSILLVQAFASQRHDDMVARQGVINHQAASHMTTLAFLNAFTEVSPSESMAMSELGRSNTPRDFGALRGSVWVPSATNPNPNA